MDAERIAELRGLYERSEKNNADAGRYAITAYTALPGTLDALEQAQAERAESVRHEERLSLLLRESEAENKRLRAVLERIASFGGRFGPSDEALIARAAIEETRRTV